MHDEMVNKQNSRHGHFKNLENDQFYFLNRELNS